MPTDPNKQDDDYGTFKEAMTYRVGSIQVWHVLIMVAILAGLIVKAV